MFCIPVGCDASSLLTIASLVVVCSPFAENEPTEPRGPVAPPQFGTPISRLYPILSSAGKRGERTQDVGHTHVQRTSIHTHGYTYRLTTFPSVHKREKQKKRALILSSTVLRD